MNKIKKISNLINFKTLSIGLLPISYIIIIFFNHLVVYLANIFIFIALVSALDIYYVTRKINDMFSNVFYIVVLILHLILLYPLIYYKKYLKPTIGGFILSFLAILIIIYLPWWPYLVKKNTFITILITINILSTIGWYLLYSPR